MKKDFPYVLVENGFTIPKHSVSNPAGLSVMSEGEKCL